MKLIRIFPRSDIDPFDKGKNVTFDDLNDISSEVTSYLDILFAPLSKILWTITYVENSNDESLICGTQIVGTDVPGIIKKCLTGNLYIRLRDASCRLVQPGQEVDVFVCLKTADTVPDPGHLLVDLMDMKTMLIETDFFDD